MQSDSLIVDDDCDKLAAMSISRFCKKYDLSENTVYRQIALGNLRAVKVGRKALIPTAAAQAWFESLPPLSTTYGLEPA